MSMHTIIYETRRALGLTQEQVAEALGVSAPAVHKWEKGCTYPDVTLLPRLARLLKVDLNTLFCFRETLTEQEVISFLEEMSGEIEAGGPQAGFAFAESLMREYPGCGALIEGMANVLQGSLILSQLTIEERQTYQPVITAWYERAMDCADEKVKNRAGFMAASQYVQNNELEKAQHILDCLPQQDLLNKNLLQADLYCRQNNPDEAVRLLQKNLLQTANDMLGILWRLVEAEMKTGNTISAKEIAKKAQMVADALDFGGYTGLIGMETIARETKNVEESLELINQMLQAATEPWNIHVSVLYHQLYQNQAKDTEIDTGSKVVPLLLKMLETDPAYDFLREEKGFQKVLERYRSDKQTADT